MRELLYITIIYEAFGFWFFNDFQTSENKKNSESIHSEFFKSLP